MRRSDLERYFSQQESGLEMETPEVETPAGEEYGEFEDRIDSFEDASLQFDLSDVSLEEEEPVDSGAVYSNFYSDLGRSVDVKRIVRNFFSSRELNRPAQYRGNITRNQKGI